MLAKPKVWDPLLQILWERGAIHEQNYVEHLTHAGLEVVRIDGVDVANEAVSQTIAAMKKGTQVIIQGAALAEMTLPRPNSAHEDQAISAECRGAGLRL